MGSQRVRHDWETFTITWVRNCSLYGNQPQLSFRTISSFQKVPACPCTFNLYFHSQLQATAHLLSVSIMLPFLEISYMDLQYAVFCIQHLSLSIGSWGSPCSNMYQFSIPFYLWGSDALHSHSFMFLHPAAEGLWIISSLTIMNNTTGNTCMQGICGHALSLLVSRFLEVELLASMVKLTCNF